MPRNITPAMLNIMNSKYWPPVLFVQLTFTSGPVYLSSLYQGLTTSLVSGVTQTWEGLGSLLSIGSIIEDGATVSARGITVTISGLDPTLLGDIQNDIQLALPVTIWLGALDNTGALVANPVILWSGGIDQPTVEFGAETASISIACEDLLILLNVAIDRRLSQQDQTINWSGDLGCNFVLAMQSKSIYWGELITTRNI